MAKRGTARKTGVKATPSKKAQASRPAKPKAAAAKAKPTAARRAATAAAPKPPVRSKSKAVAAVAKLAATRPAKNHAKSLVSSRDNGREMPQSPPESLASPLSDEELQEFRDLLLAKRRELAGDVANLQNEAAQLGGSGGGGSSTMPLHMADLGSDTWEQELTLGLIANERTLLREIDEALQRIDNHTYGICMATGKPITKARLHAKPWAKYCIEYARKRELGLV